MAATAPRSDARPRPSAPAAGPPASAATTSRSRREEVAIAFFASWMLLGLYLDGWAHGADKPESFFTPWHGVLYSGFVAALAWFAVEGLRQGRSATATLSPADRLAGLGLGIFAVGAVGDGLWHQIFGVEVDLEALLSPTHLLLLIGGFLMVTAPVRAAAADPTEDAATLRRFLPTVVCMTLAAALVSFFSMYLSAFEGTGYYWVQGGEDVRELVEIAGVGAVLASNLILLAPVLFALRRWRTPFGTFTILFTAVGFSMTAIEGFDRVELALPALLGGLVADVLVRRGSSARLVAGVVPLALWSAYFAVVEVSIGVEFAAELVAGSVVLAVVSGLLLAALTAPPRVAAPAG
jgi:hypothetical protein